MKLTLTKAGLRVTTKDHGVTEYFGHRIHLVTAHHSHPKLLVWVYQHVGRTLKTEIRCHAALCQRGQDAHAIESQLNVKLRECFLEYKREKRRLQNSRLCNTRNHGVLEEQLGVKKKTFRTLTRNYKPPVQHGMCAAPKLDDVVEEDEENDVCDEDDEDEIEIIGEEDECEEGDEIIENDEEIEEEGGVETNSESSENQMEEEEDDDEDEDDDDEADYYEGGHNIGKFKNKIDSF